ncbi:hypothetical protein, partial [Avibacterium endocarditidis]|uniref:hypothetical protein n=1 Tax=Avibacterium endocarditidis TaxID=380674 RepID=UPI001CA51458
DFVSLRYTKLQFFSPKNLTSIRARLKGTRWSVNRENIIKFKICEHYPHSCDKSRQNPHIVAQVG